MKWDHAGIKARDMQASLDFYINKLGLRQLEIITLFGTDFYFVGNDNIRIEIEPCKPDDTQAAMDSMSGLYHMALNVDDIEGLAARLQEHGVKFRLPVSQFRPDRKIAFIEDPDGTIIQLIQYL